MRYLKLFEEINGRSEPYKWSKKDNNNYLFEDDNLNDYWVEFIKTGSGKYEMKFYSQEPTFGEWSLYVLTGSNIYRVLETIFGEIVTSFLNETKPKELFIQGLGRDKEREFVTSRTKVYNRYLERNPINGYKTTLIGNNIYLRK